jgi:predicted nucleic acid-binding protein
VKIADVQILFYAVDATSDLHPIAARWLEDSINASEAFALTWSTIFQFLRLGTNPAYPGYMTDAEAHSWVEEWVAAGVEVISDSDLRWELVSELVGVSPRATRDTIDGAQLAGVAISRGATLASFDPDFACFVGSGLRWEQLGAAATSA